jgi:hypothetical protein
VPIRIVPSVHSLLKMPLNLRDGVHYRIQNVDTRAFLELRGQTGELVTRPEKDSEKQQASTNRYANLHQYCLVPCHQQWIFELDSTPRPRPNHTGKFYKIKNVASTNENQFSEVLYLTGPIPSSAEIGHTVSAKCQAEDDATIAWEIHEVTPGIWFVLTTLMVLTLMRHQSYHVPKAAILWPLC